MPLEQSSLTTEIVRWPVIPADTTRDLTGATAHVACVAVGVTPAATDWLVATIANPAGPNREIRLLIGPDGGAINWTGDRQSWTKIGANPETIVRRKGVISRT